MINICKSVAQIEESFPNIYFIIQIDCNLCSMYI